MPRKTYRQRAEALNQARQTIKNLESRLENSQEVALVRMSTIKRLQEGRASQARTIERLEETIRKKNDFIRSIKKSIEGHLNMHWFPEEKGLCRECGGRGAVNASPYTTEDCTACQGTGIVQH